MCTHRNIFHRQQYFITSTHSTNNEYTNTYQQYTSAQRAQYTTSKPKKWTADAQNQASVWYEHGSAGRMKKTGHADPLFSYACQITHKTKHIRHLSAPWE